MDFRRSYIPGGSYFFTVVTEQRNPLLIDNIDRLREAFRYTINKRPFTIDAIVVLPDHIHTIWTLPPEDTDYSSRWSLLKRYFSTHLPIPSANKSKQSRREKGVWQRRFWEHTLRDESDWRNHLDYIHYNPVKHGYTHQVNEWPYSSFHRSVKWGWYESSWGENISSTVKQMNHE